MYDILVPTANSLRTVCMILYVDMLSLCDHIGCCLRMLAGRREMLKKVMGLIQKIETQTVK